MVTHDWKRVYFVALSAEDSEGELANWLSKNFKINEKSETGYLNRTERRQIGELLYEEFVLLCQGEAFENVRNWIVEGKVLPPHLHNVRLPSEQDHPFSRLFWGPKGNVQIERTEFPGQKVGMSPADVAESNGW